MKTQHTPGPWIFDADNYNLTNKKGEIVFGEDGSQDMRLISPSKENARLIAAAPDLLEALEKMIWILDLNELPSGQGIQKAFFDAKKILKKARGES